jgi:hypothetical protein
VTWRNPGSPHYEQLRDLERRFPGWQIWVSGPTWCARPWPLINCDSPEELAERIRTAHSQPPDGSPSLASWRSYVARVRALREYEEAAAATWKRMKAEADRWRRFPLRHRTGHTAPPAASEADTGAAARPEGQALPDIIA